MVSVSDAIPMLLLYIGYMEEGVEFSGEKKIFYFCCRRGRKREEKEKKKRCFEKTDASFVLFWLRGAVQPPAPARWQRPPQRIWYHRDMVGNRRSRAFLFQIELAGQNVICDMEEKDIPKVTSYLISKNVPIFGIASVSKSLEQIFMDVVNNKQN